MGQTLCTESAFEQRLSNGRVTAFHERLDCVPFQETNETNKWLFYVFVFVAT